MPELEAAQRALATLKKSDISEVKAMKSPPDGVKLVMSAVCIMLGVAEKKAGAGPGSKKVPYIFDGGFFGVWDVFTFIWC